MKKVLSLLLALILIVSLCACTNEGSTPATNPIKDITTPTTVLTSTPTTVPTTVPTSTPSTAPTTAPTSTPTETKHTHNWKPATCSEPKTCTICGTTSGLTAEHAFSNGKCTSCGKADPDYIQETMVWIPTKGGTKYHSHAGCSNMISPTKVTKSEAERLGFTPCKRCY